MSLCQISRQIGVAFSVCPSTVAGCPLVWVGLVAWAVGGRLVGVVGTNEPMTRFGLQARAFVLMDGKASGFQRDKFDSLSSFRLNFGF